MSLGAGVETARLIHAVKNAWTRREPARLQGVLRAPKGAGEWELIMSTRIAVALAATIGAGIAMSSAAQARPEMVDINGEYTPGTIVVKTHERRLYLILDSRRALPY